MKKYLLSFAEGDIYKKSQFNLDKTIDKADIDIHIKWDLKKLKETEFYTKNKSLIDKQPGYGFWVWKPYIILDQLKQIKDDDILIYMDASRYETDGFKNSCQSVIEFMNKYNLDLIPGFKTNNKNFEMIKPECLEYFNLKNNDSFLNLYNTFTSPMFLKKTNFNLTFLSEWLDACLIEANVSHQNLEYLGGITHIYDQAVLNCLMYKYTIVSFAPDTIVEKDFRKYTYYFNYFKNKNYS